MNFDEAKSMSIHKAINQPSWILVHFQTNFECILNQI